MANTKIIHVPFLGGTDVGYQMRNTYNPSKPTLLMIHAFASSSDLFKPQYEDKALNDMMNLVAIELLGHGKTRTKSEQFNYWDMSTLNLQVMDLLGINKVFVLGTTHGGWIGVRMELLAPEKIQGVIPMGCTMDCESERMRSFGCWDGWAACTPNIAAWTTNDATPDFRPESGYANFLIELGFGADIDPDSRAFWLKSIEETYSGDDGRKKLRMATINLRDRDGLFGRMADVKCPILWLHGTEDKVCTVLNAEDEIKLFTNAKVAEVRAIEGGQHFLCASNPKEVNSAVIEFVGKWAS